MHNNIEKKWNLYGGKWNLYGAKWNLYGAKWNFYGGENFSLKFCKTAPTLDKKCSVFCS